MSDYYGMAFERYDYLMDEEGPCVHLTEDEIKEGWHFCMDWDSLLIHPDSDEFHSCTCPHMQSYKTEARSKAYEERRAKAHEALDRIAQFDEEFGLIAKDTFYKFKNSKGEE